MLGEVEHSGGQSVADVGDRGDDGKNIAWAKMIGTHDPDHLGPVRDSYCG